MGTSRDSSMKIVQGRFSCPCGGEFGIGLNNAGAADSVTHTLPMCTKYEALEVDEFLVYVREHDERQRQ